jgi:uncharacterized protein involved in exopolysaccharide biosynthesis/Mrp family chromosome partitioning ATPase
MSQSNSSSQSRYGGPSIDLVDAELNPQMEIRRVPEPGLKMQPIAHYGATSDDLTIEEVKNIFRRYRRLIGSCVVFFLLVATAYCIIAKRRYASVGQLELAKTELSALDSLGNATNGPSAASTSDAVDFALTQPTQVSILESETLALQVMRELDLEATDDYFKKKEGSGGLAMPRWLSFLAEPLEPLSVPLADAPNRRAKALKIFRKRLVVKPVTGSRLISVTYYSPDPKLAAAVVNQLMSDYSDFEFQARLSNTNRAELWIATQLQELKQKTEALQNNAIRLQRETGLFGQDESHNIVTARLDALNVEATAAETNRILKEAIYDEVKAGDPELITGLNGNSLNGSTALNQNSLTLLASLRLQEETLRPEVADYASRYLPNHPKLIQLRAQLADVEKAINQETARIRDRAKSDYDIARATEVESKRKLEAQKAEALQLNDKNTAYVLAKQEADNSAALYSGLLAKLKQTNILEGLKASSVVIVDPGRVPSSYDAAKPNLPLIYAIAFGAGLIVGILCSLWLYQRMLRFQSISEVNRDPYMYVAGCLPEAVAEHRNLWRTAKKFIGLPVKPISGGGGQDFLDRNPLYVAGMLALRTSILLPEVGAVPQVIMTASTVPPEGESTVGRNLASALSNTGANTLYVDADLGLGSFDADGSHIAKLSTQLAADGGSVGESTTASNGFSRRVSSNLSASDLLGSDRMRQLIQKWRGEFDYVVIHVDSPLPATEAAIMARFADLLLLIVQPGITTAQAFKSVRKRLAEALPIGSRMGVVFDGVPEQAIEFTDYFGETSTVGGIR